MANSENSKNPNLDQNDILQEFHDAEHLPSHNQKWAAIEAQDAGMARDAIVTATRLNDEGIGSREAYLRGVADTHHRHLRQGLIRDVMGDLSQLKEVPEPDIDPSL